MAKKKTLNPADQARRAEKERIRKKNAKERHQYRELTRVTKDPQSIRDELAKLRALAKQNKLNFQQKKRYEEVLGLWQKVETKVKEVVDCKSSNEKEDEEYFQRKLDELRRKKGVLRKQSSSEGSSDGASSDSNDSESNRSGDESHSDSDSENSESAPPLPDEPIPEDILIGATASPVGPLMYHHPRPVMPPPGMLGAMGAHPGYFPPGVLPVILPAMPGRPPIPAMVPTTPVRPVVVPPISSPAAAGGVPGPLPHPVNRPPVDIRPQIPLDIESQGAPLPANLSNGAMMSDSLGNKPVDGAVQEPPKPMANAVPSAATLFIPTQVVKNKSEGKAAQHQTKTTSISALGRHTQLPGSSSQDLPAKIKSLMRASSDAVASSSRQTPEEMDQAFDQFLKEVGSG